jgi:hypothetical protein
MVSGFGVDGMIAGAIGGVLYEASRWFGLSRKRVMPHYLWKLHYWVLTLLQVVAGGVTAGFLTPSGGLASFLVGLAGPALLSRLGALTLQSIHLGPASRMAAADASAQEWFRG